MRPLLYATLSILFAVGPARAATVLTWGECVDLAAKNNADLRTAAEQLRSSEFQEGAARSGFFPQVSGSLNYNRASTSVNGVTTTTQLDNYSASLSATQSIFNGLQTYGQTTQARANTRATRASARITRAQVSADLKTAFEGVTYADDYEKLTQEIIKRREENLRLVELRFESGRENKGSVLLSEAYLHQAKYDDLQAHDARRVAQAQLAKALGFDDFENRDVAGHVPTQSPSAAAPDFKALALTTPEYAQAVAQEEAAEAGVTVARAGFFPNLELTATTGRFDTDFFPDNTHRWSVAVNLNIPLFSGGRDYFTTRSAAASWTASMSRRESVTRDRVTQLEQAYARYTEAVMKLKMDDSFRQAATLRAEIARKKYNNGLQTFEDWDIIENDLISRQKTYLQSKRDRVTAEAAWEQAQGKGVFNE